MFTTRSQQLRLRLEALETWHAERRRLVSRQFDLREREVSPGTPPVECRVGAELALVGGSETVVSTQQRLAEEHVEVVAGERYAA